MNPLPHPSYFARMTPDKPALIMIEENTSISYAELVTRANRAANLFQDMGIREYDTIAIMMENNIRYPEILWAAKDSGLHYVTISNRLNAEEAAYIVNDSGAKLLITSHATSDTATELLPHLDHPVLLLMVDGAAGNFKSYEENLALCSSNPLNGRRRGASMLYSSGTTGKPKGIKTDIADVPSTVPPQRFPITIEKYEFTEESIFNNSGPFYHAGPLRFMMMILRVGGTVIGFRKFDPERVLKAISDFRCTHGFFVPTMFRRMLNLPPELRSSLDISSMRHAIHAAAPCPPEVKRQMIDWWGPVVDELYSGTEAVGHTYINSEEWLKHPGSVGRPASNCVVKIVDAENRILPVGTAGEIKMTNGLKVEYHGATSAESLYDQDGFASLGDVGYLDEDGYLYLTDRKSHMIIVGGINIYPQEAEQILMQHARVDDVAVIGIPHDDLGEEIKAMIQPTTMPKDRNKLEAEIIEFCQSRLSKMKCPRSIDFIEKLPRNEMGKLSKHKLREKYWANRQSMI